MITGSRRVKDLIKNRAAGDSAKAQALLRHYAIERFLERVSVSSYKGNFILKGGMLISSMLGIDSRMTMDIDTTLTGVTLDIESAQAIISEIADIELGDGMKFALKEAYEIMEDSEYGGVRVPMEARLERTRIPMKIDISTGDAITPREIEYGYRLMFEERSIGIMAYPIETVIAEKMETALVRGTLNTRMRDYYDIYMLAEVNKVISGSALSQALRATSEKRGSDLDEKKFNEIIGSISTSPVLAKRWDSYSSANSYVGYVGWDQALAAFNSLCALILQTEN